MFPANTDELIRSELFSVERLEQPAASLAATQRITTSMHNTTHIDAPAHVVQGTPFIDEVPLPHFFGSGLATAAGGACSSTAISALIKQLVSEEDGKHPLTDSRMSEILAQQGILVARRTVAKYREGMNILPVNLRKSL